MERISLKAVVTSEYAIRILSSLDGSSNDLNNLHISLGITKKILLSNIKLLEECYLVRDENGIYKLTQLGELIARKLNSLLCIEEFMDSNDGYWVNHDLSFIPLPLMQKLPDLSSCTIIQYTLPAILDHNEDAHEISMSSNSFSMLASCLHPNFSDLFSDLIDKDVHLSLIFDADLFDNLKKENYNKLQELVNSEQVKLYLYPGKIKLISLKMNDSCILLRLLTNKGVYDYKQLVCCSPLALEWGKELFEYYLKDSMPINKI